MAFSINGAFIPPQQATCTTSSATQKNNGTFRWDDAKDIVLLREVRMQEPYLERVGSKEAGIKWSDIASTLNTYVGFKDSPRDQRSVRERFSKLLSDFKAKIRKEENSSGTNPPDLSEKEVILEEIKEIIASNGNKQTKPSSANEKNERAKALSIRDKAMKTWSKTKNKGEEDTLEGESDSEESFSSGVSDEPKERKGRKRRGSSEALDYIQKRYTGEYELRKQELEIKKEQFEMEHKRVDLEVKRQEQMQYLIMQQQRQMAAQQQEQQQQITQQMEMQGQIIALLAKMSK